MVVPAAQWLRAASSTGRTFFNGMKLHERLFQMRISPSKIALLKFACTYHPVFNPEADNMLSQTVRLSHPHPHRLSTYENKR